MDLKSLSDFLAPFSIVIVWLGFGFGFSRLGWYGFAKKYAAATRPTGPSFNCRCAWFGSEFFSYRNVMRVVFSNAGIYIYPLVLFRAFHSPFLVPWDKVVGVAETRLWAPWHELEVRDGTREIHLLLNEEALQEYRKFKG